MAWPRGTAYFAGFRYALAHGYDYVVQMDADLSHRPQDLPLLLEAVTRADLAIGSRNVSGGRVENWPLSRRVISKGGSVYARAVLGIPVKDCTGGFKCFHRRALLAINLDGITSNGFGFQVEMIYLCYRAGLRIAEAPIVFPDRTRGHSKMSYKIFAEAAALVWRLRYRAMRGSLAVGARPSIIGVDHTPVSTTVAIADACGAPENTLTVDGIADIVHRQVPRPRIVDIA
jgi:dolichol-phosphate mannosyltransferase